MPLSAMKALKPTTPQAASSSMLLDVARDEPAPEREVDVRGALRGGQLGLERAGVDGRRVGVQRHVDARR